MMYWAAFSKYLILEIGHINLRFDVLNFDLQSCTTQDEGHLCIWWPLPFNLVVFTSKVTFLIYWIFDHAGVPFGFDVWIWSMYTCISAVYVYTGIPFYFPILSLLLFLLGSSLFNKILYCFRTVSFIFTQILCSLFLHPFFWDNLQWSQF